MKAHWATTALRCFVALGVALTSGCAHGRYAPGIGGTARHMGTKTSCAEFEKEIYYVDEKGNTVSRGHEGRCARSVTIHGKDYVEDESWSLAFRFPGHVGVSSLHYPGRGYAIGPAIGTGVDLIYVFDGDKFGVAAGGRLDYMSGNFDSDFRLFGIHAYGHLEGLYALHKRVVLYGGAGYGWLMTDLAGVQGSHRSFDSKAVSAEAGILFVVVRRELGDITLGLTARGYRSGDVDFYGKPIEFQGGVLGINGYFGQ